MSEKPELKLAKKTKKEQEWWMQRDKLRIFKLLIAGKTFQEIIEETNTKALALQDTIGNPYFLRKLENYLSRIFFSFQVNKILSMDEILKLYWDVVTGKKEIEGLSRDQASKHYIKILTLKAQDPKVINPKQYNLIMNVFKPGSPDKITGLAEEFGFDKLQIPKDEGPKTHPQLDTGKSDQNEQRKED